MKSYLIHLIRHGMTEGNLNGKYVGSTDLPLCDEGENQINDFCKKYQYPDADLYFTSPMLRCKQTIHMIYPNAAYRVVPGLAEHSFGEFEGKTIEDLKDNKDFEKWIKEGIAPEGVEDNIDFAKRVCNAFNNTVKDILTSGKQSAVICAHGGVIMTILSAYGFPKREMIEWMCDNGRGYTIRITPGLWMRDGSFEIEGFVPTGSEDEPDLSVNPMKQGM